MAKVRRCKNWAWVTYFQHTNRATKGVLYWAQDWSRQDPLRRYGLETIRPV